MPMNFDVERTRAYLIAKRNFYGAKTPIGHRCSNLIEQLGNLRSATVCENNVAKAKLEKFIGQSVAELAKLSN